MKQNIFLSATLILGLFATSCQKEKSNEQGSQPTTNSSRVKTYTEAITSSFGNSTTTYNLSYDNSGRISSMVSASAPGDKFVFSYPSNTSYTMEIFANGLLTIHENFFLNADSFVDSSFQYNDTQDTTTEKYSYNANKQLVQIKEYEYTKATGGILYNTTKYFYDADGNLARTEDTEDNVHLYEYYSNLVYTQPLNIAPMSIATAKKANLVKKHTLMSGGFTEMTAEFTYTFDNKDRISTEKATLSDGSVVTKTYTYF